MKITYTTKIVDKSPEFLRKLEKSFAKIMWGMEADAKRYAPVDTGRLRNSINLTQKSPYHYVLNDGVYYGIMVEYGTKPHIIRPREKKALHWKTEAGKDVFAMEVHHPGTNSSPFFRPALSVAKLKIKTLLNQ